MPDFEPLNSVFDWAIGKYCDNILKIVQKNLHEFNEKSKVKNMISLPSFLIDESKELPTFFLETKEEELFKQLDYRLKMAESWSKIIRFKDLKGAKEVLKIFIDLNLYLTVRRVHMGGAHEEIIPITTLLSRFSNNVVLLGPPGAGKTTISKYLCSHLLLREQEWAKNYAGPLVIRLRDIDYRFENEYNVDSIYYHILGYLGLRIKIHFEDENLQKKKKNHKAGYYISTVLKQITTEILDSLHMVIIFEGFDEIPNKASQNVYLKEMQELFLTLQNSKIFLTSRTGEFNVVMDNAETYEIAPLSLDQVNQFVIKWLDSSEKSKNLIKQIMDSPYRDTTMRPINVAHLCALFERYGEIPLKPKEVYKKIIRLMTDDWDTQRRISRKSIYQKFPNDRKFDFLATIAFLLTTEFNSLTFSREELRVCYHQIHSDFSLPLSEMDDVINEIESHIGLFSQCGFDTYEFSHKSIQEYLTAEYISRLPIDSLGYANLVNLPDELAITTALSSRPSIFFSILILKHLSSLLINYSFVKPFLARILDEKPDFDVSGLLALAIHRMYITNIIKNAGNLFERTNVEIEIDKFISSHGNILKSFIKLSDYYFDDSNIYLKINNGALDEKYFVDQSITLIKKNGFKEFAYDQMDNKIEMPFKYYKIMYNLA